MSGKVPIVWYIAAGYKLPAGIEAYLLHYATEIRNQGFVPRIVVLEPLPTVPHRFLVALRERCIPIESLYERVSRVAKVACIASYIPWRVRATGRKLLSCSVVQLLWESAASPGQLSSCSVVQLLSESANAPSSLPSTTQQLSNSTTFASLQAYWLKRLAVRELKRMIEREKPDIIHVKGRIICEAFPVLPSEKTVYQHALMGTRDPSWEDAEAEAFSVFLNRIAKVLVQGKGIAGTFARSFNIRRPIDVVYTMAPDELAPEARAQLLGCQVVELLGKKEVSNEEPAARREEISCSVAKLLREEPSVSHSTTQQLNNLTANPKPSLRFGILCRFTEQKGIPYILEALRMYRDRHGAVDFTFAGQGPLEPRIREAVVELLSCSVAKLPPSAHGEEISCQVAELLSERPAVSSISASTTQQPNNLTTYRASGATQQPNNLATTPAGAIRVIPVDSAVNVLRELDVFVHPGLDDAMPVSIVEALMCGVPCIVSDVGASPELVRHGVEGFVIKPASGMEILKAMERFAAMDESELHGFKERARRRYEAACRPEVVGGQVASLYRDVLQKGASGVCVGTPNIMWFGKAKSRKRVG